MIPLVLGGWMFTSSFSTNTIQQSVTPYSTQQQTVEVEMPEPAKSFLRFGGGAIAILGTSSLVFWELASKKRLQQKPQLLLAGQSFAPNGYYSQNNQPISQPQNIAVTEHRESFPNPQNTEVRGRLNKPVIAPNFYQTDCFPSSNFSPGNIEQFQPQGQSEDKYASVRSRSGSEGASLVYENTVGIVGKEKGSGKTSKLGYLIAEHIKLGHLVWMVNPFAKGQHWKGIKVFGRGYNFLEATNAIREFTRIAFWRIAEAGDETKE